MSINLQTGGYTPQLLGASSTDIQVPQNQPKQYPETLPVPGDSAATPKDAEQQRYDQVFAAAQNASGNNYAVSDKSFTIFKNVDGQYVTRYTSLRDGKVTYVPEQSLVQVIGPGQQTKQTSVHIKA